MSIEAKHAYRFGYLKSEQWQTVRIAALARERGRCQICREFSVSNDAHHIEYAANIYETKEDHLVILCRPCHDLIHDLLEIHNCKGHSKFQFFKIAKSLFDWKLDRAEWKPVESDELVCQVCLQTTTALRRHRFFEKFGRLKRFEIQCCDDCIESAKREVEPYDHLPEKAYKIYDGWKKKRKT